MNDKTPNWGAGFGLAVRKKWPRVQAAFQEWVASEPEALTLGNVHHMRVDDTTTVFQMVCQHGYGPSPTTRLRYAALKRCLERLAEFAVSVGASIHMPRIGAGYGGGSWGLIQQLIDEVLSAPAAAVGKLMVFPLGKEMFGLLLVIVAVMLLKVPLPSLCKVTLRCPVSPASSTPSLSHEVPSSVRLELA